MCSENSKSMNMVITVEKSGEVNAIALGAAFSDVLVRSVTSHHHHCISMGLPHHGMV